MKNKILKLLSLTGILSIMLVSTIFAYIPRVQVQWNAPDFWGNYTVNNVNDVKGKIVYDTGYSNHYAFDSSGKWVKTKGLFKGSNGYAVINNKGEAFSQGWAQTWDDYGNYYVYIKDWELVKDKFIDISENPSTDFPNGKKCYYVDSTGKMLTNTQITKNGVPYKIDGNGYVTPGNKTGLFGESAWVGNILKNKNGETISDRWANKDGSKIEMYFSEKDGLTYRSDANGRMIIGRVFSVGDDDYIANNTGKCAKYEPEEDYKVDSSLKDLDVKIVNWIKKGGKHKANDEWVNLGGGDYALWHDGKWSTRRWEGKVGSDGKSQKWYRVGANGLMFRNMKAYGTDENFTEITTDKNRAYKDPGTKKYFECAFANDGQWEMTLSSDFKKYLSTNKKNMDEMTVSEMGQYYSAFLNKAEKASLKSILDLQEKAEKANSSKEVEQLDEQVNNEFSLPIEIYTKDQFYKGKYSKGQVGEKEYLTNGYYIYNKGSNKYTLYKANDTIGKTSKVIKSNVSLAKIADYIDDNDIEKSAEIKEKTDSSSSKSSSKKDKKLKVTIKSGYKTKDKIVNEIDYEGSYTLPTFEEMNWEEKPKYSFSHWAIGSKKYNPGDVVDNIKANKTITAKWKKN